MRIFLGLVGLTFYMFYLVLRIGLGLVGSVLLVLFSYADHPRFGRIRSICALHDMEPGEEVTTDYRFNNALKTNKIQFFPRFYTERPCYPFHIMVLRQNALHKVFQKKILHDIFLSV